MPAIRLRAFQGMAPKISSRLLADQQAELASNCALYSGEIRALSQGDLDDVLTLGGLSIGTIHLWRGGGQERWLRFPERVHVARSPLNEDVRHRVYWAGDPRTPGPRMSYTPVIYDGVSGEYPTVSYRLGVPAPTQAVSLAEVPLPSGTIDAIDLNANPVRITSVGHGLVSDDRVTIAQTGLDELDEATSFMVAVIDDDTFDLTLTNASGWDTEGWSYGGAGVFDTFVEQVNITTRFYVYTYVTNLGEEGPPSPASAGIDVAHWQAVDVSGLEVDAAASNGRIIENIRVYRTATGDVSAQFQFVGEFPAATASFTDTVQTAALGETIPTVEWDPPPSELKGLINLPNGILCGFEGQGVWFSEAYVPHAWPGSYQLTVPHDIVGIGAFDVSVVACTEGPPTIFTGSDPRSMAQRNLEENQGCLSERGIVSMGYGVMYPGPDGLVLVSNSGASVVTEPLMTGKEWKAYEPATIHAYEWRGGYLGFYDGGGFYFNPRDERAGFIEIDFDCVTGFRDYLSESLFLLLADGSLLRWDDGGGPLRYTWRSKTYEYPSDVTFGVVRVYADGYEDLRMRVWCDHIMLADLNIRGPAPHRLPPRKGRAWRIELTGTETVRECSMATRPRDL